jgi:hypothetical protein
MGLSKDWNEFLALLNCRGVDYIIVGAHSLALHGLQRYTGDLDILVRSTPQNARILVAILDEFGFAQSGFKEADFVKSEQLIQLGRAPTELIYSQASAALAAKKRLPARFRQNSMGFPSLS